MSIGQEAFRGQISQSHLFEFIVRWSGVSPASQFVLGRHDLVPKSWFRFQLGRRGYVVKNLIEDELVGGESRMEKSGLFRLDDEGMLGEKVGQGLVKRVTRFQRARGSGRRIWKQAGIEMNLVLGSGFGEWGRKGCGSLWRLWRLWSLEGGIDLIEVWTKQCVEVITELVGQTQKIAIGGCGRVKSMSWMKE